MIQGGRRIVLGGAPPRFTSQDAWLSSTVPLWL
jgi:hypothetical protein